MLQSTHLLGVSGGAGAAVTRVAGFEPADWRFLETTDHRLATVQRRWADLGVHGCDWTRKCSKSGSSQERSTVMALEGKSDTLDKKTPNNLDNKKDLRSAVKVHCRFKVCRIRRMNKLIIRTSLEV